MGKGGYSGPSESIGLLGCAIVAPLYLIALAFVVEDYGYGGTGLQFLAALTVATAVAFGLVQMINQLGRWLGRRAK
jgi:hypothetical protein